MAGIDLYNAFTVDDSSAPTTFTTQALRTSAATTPTMTLDLRPGFSATANPLGTADLKNPDIGMGKPVFANIVVTKGTTVASSTTAATAVFALQSSTDTTTWIVLDQTRALTVTELNTEPGAASSGAGGFRTFFAVPPGADRYLRILETTGTEGFSAGNFSAWLSGEPLGTV